MRPTCHRPFEANQTPACLRRRFALWRWACWHLFQRAADADDKPS